MRTAFLAAAFAAALAGSAQADPPQRLANLIQMPIAGAGPTAPSWTAGGVGGSAHGSICTGGCTDTIASTTSQYVVAGLLIYSPAAGVDATATFNIGTSATKVTGSDHSTVGGSSVVYLIEGVTPGTTSVTATVSCAGCAAGTSWIVYDGLDRPVGNSTKFERAASNQNASSTSTTCTAAGAATISNDLAFTIGDQTDTAGVGTKSFTSTTGSWTSTPDPLGQAITETPKYQVPIDTSTTYNGTVHNTITGEGFCSIVYFTP